MSALAVETPGLRRVEHLMGMPIVLDLRDEDVDQAAVDAMFDWLHGVDATFSTYKDDSEISRLNRGELALEDTQADVQHVLARCEQLREETAGYFDARATGTLAVRPRQGLVGRSGRGDPPRGRNAELRGQRRR